MSFLFSYVKANPLDWDSVATNNRISAMLVKADVVASITPEMLSTNDLPVDCEPDGPGYTAGFNGSGRRLVTGRTVVVDDANNVALLNADAMEWVGIDVGSVGALVVLLGGPDAALLIALIDEPPFPVDTGGGTLRFTFPSGMVVVS